MHDGKVRLYDLRGIADGGPGAVVVPLMLRAGFAERRRRQEVRRRALEVGGTILLAIVAWPILAFGVSALVSFLR